MTMMDRRSTRGALAIVSAVAGLVVATPGAAALPGSVTPTVAEQTVAATSLAQNLCQQITQLTTRASTEQVEAAIVYALSQSTQPIAVQRLALDRIPATCSLGASMSAGLRNAQIALLRGATSGTAGLTTARNTVSSGSSLGNSAFSSPAVAVGGGSVNYSSTNAR